MEKKQLVFLAKFFLIFFALHTVMYFLPQVSCLQDFIASFEAGLLGLPFEGDQIFIGRQAFAITASCTGLVASFILIAVIFALKQPELKEKIAIAVLGSAALLLINLLRVYLVLLAALSFGVQWAEALHFFSWFVMAGLVIGIWYYGVTKVYKKKSLAGFL